MNLGVHLTDILKRSRSNDLDDLYTTITRTVGDHLGDGRLFKGHRGRGLEMLDRWRGVLCVFSGPRPGRRVALFDEGQPL